MTSSTALDPQVLVVDDDDQLSRTLADILRLRGFRPFTVSSARRGLEKAKELAPELAIALVDLRLPDMDGMELVARLRSLSDLTEVVVLTGHASMDSVLGALRQESFDYLIKPVDPDRLLDTMARASERWQRRVVEQRLHEAEEKFRLVVENISDLILLLDDSGRIKYASPSASHILQRDPDSLLGRALPGLMSPAAGLRMEEILTGLLAGDSGTVSIEHDLNGGEGREAHVDSTVQRILTGPSSGFLVSSRDISERKHLEAELFQSRKMESVGRLAGGIAHDFNNLLTVVMGASELCRLEAGAEFEQRPYLDEVVAAAQRGSAMVRQLLAFSRRQVLTPRVIDVNALIEDGRKLLERAIGEDIFIHLDLSAERPHVLADAGQLEQVLMNLAVNARDAMRRGGRLMIRTQSGAKAGPDWVTIQVADTGDGIPPETLQQIFEPFFTTKELGRGTGLGLATVQGIIQQSGGRISVESQPREGATFTIELPRVDAVSTTQAPRVQQVERTAGQETILLVEDEKAVRNVIARSLQRHGYKVIEATTGTEAAEILRVGQERIDLLLTDLVLPGLTGLELVELGKKLRPGVRALLCSGYSEDAITRRGVTADVRVLAKPFEPRQLLAAVRAALDDQGLDEALS